MSGSLKSGKFIVFEGLDGSGQSTQVKLLGNFLKKRGNLVLTTKEPTKNSQAGKVIKEVLLKKKKLSPKKLQQLFAQDRKLHLKKIIIPALKKGKIVISDRYFFSSFSYGMAEGLSKKELLRLNEKFLLPDIVFFLDVSPSVCMERIKKRAKEKTIFEKKSKLEKVYCFYKEILKDFQKKTKIYFIKGEGSIEEVFLAIKNFYD